ncbi:MAG: DUF2807 domain-containing protein [Bacteroidales bacterium]|nr:DUF2807 domain-containing protein [Bacteroidales bacterium]
MKTKNVIPGILLVLTGLLFTGCYDHWHKVDGNHNVVTETRQLPDFSGVVNEGSFDVYIIQDGLSEVEIEAESNLIPLIRTRIQGSSLVIDTQDNLHNNYPMKLYVHTEDIREVKLSGSGLIHAEDIEAGDLETRISGSGYLFISGTGDIVECSISGSGSIDLGINCDELEADISGSGEMEIWGTADKGDFNISGSGSIRSYELLLQECYADISGSGSMYVNVEDLLDVDISGSGSVYYLGSPVIDSHITGSGSIIHP